MRVVVAVIALVAAQPASASVFEQVRATWAEARTIAATNAGKSLPLFERAIAESPGNNGLLLSAINAAIDARDSARARAWLAHYAGQGGALSAAGITAVREAIGAEADDPLIVSLTDNGKPVGRAEVAAMIPATAHLIEGVAADARGIYVSSVYNAVIRKVGAAAPFVTLPPDAGSPLALAMDSKRGVLWAALDPDAPRATKGAVRGGMLRVRLGDRRMTVLAPKNGGAAHLGDTMVAGDGAVYGADGRSGGVYRCRPGCTALETLIAPGVLRSAQGMALSRDGRRLYVSDYGYGIAIVDLKTRAVSRLATAPGIALDGIDGMVADRGRIVAVQNGWKQPRVVAITLDRDGGEAIGLKILLRGHPLGNDPTQVARDGKGGLLLVGNAQWDSYDEAHPAPDQQRPTNVLRLNPR